MTSNLFPCVMKHIVQESLTKSGFVSSINANRLNVLIDNNVDDTLTKLGVTQFHQGKSCSLITSHLKNAFDSADTQNVKTVEKLIKTEHSQYASMLTNDFTRSWATIFSTSKDELDKCYADVDFLIQQFQSEESRLAKALPIPDYKDTPVNVESWNLTGLFGLEHHFVADVNKNTSVQSKEPSLTAFRILATKTRINQSEITKTLSPLKLTDEKKQLIIEKISKYSGLSTDKVGLVFSSICSENGTNFFFQETTAIEGGASLKNFERTKTTVQLIEAFLKGYDKALSAKDDEATYIDNKTVDTNLAYLKEIQKLGVYAMIYYRYGNWSNLLILPNGMVNSDLQAEATSLGITKEDLRLAIYSNDFSTGYSVLSPAFVKDNKEKWFNDFAKKLENAKIDEAMKNRDTKRAAFNKVVTGYLSNHKCLSTHKGLSEVLAGDISTHGKSPEQCLYTLVQAVHNVSPLTKSIIANMTNAFGALEAQCDKIEKRSVEEVKAIVLIKQMVGSIAKHFCE